MKTNFRRFTAMVLCIAMLALFGACAKGGNSGQNANTNSPGPEDTASDQSYTCTVTVDATNAYKYEGLDSAIRDSFINEGLLLNKAMMTGLSAHTVTEIFKSACSLSGILVDIEQGDYGSFIKGIGGLHNGDCGENSYWLLKVNGEFPDVGADQIIVKDGDEIVWVYTCDGGADVGYSWQE